MQGVLDLVGRLLAPMEAVKAVFVITLLATHFSIAYDKPIAVLLQAEYIRGWQLRVVMLLEKVRSLHVAAAFSIVYSQVLSAVLRIKPVRQALGEQACTEVLNAWRCSRPYLLAAAATSDAAMARSVRAAGDQASLQQQQQQQDGVQALVAAASGTDDPVLQMHYYMQHLQGELERVEALEHWKRVEQVRMRAVAVTMRRMPAGLAGLGCCKWHLLVTHGIRQGLQLTSALLPTQMCAALSCLYTCAAIASVQNRSRQALMWPRLRQRLRYQHR